MLNLLLSSAGRRVELMNCFRVDAIGLGLKLRVIAADLRPASSAACQLADKAVSVPPCSSPDYVPALLSTCRAEQVHILVPTIDTELQVLSERRHEFAAIGTEVIVSAPGVVGLARDKEATARALEMAGICIPATLSAGHFLDDPSRLQPPLIVKPRGGSSSMGLVRAATLDQAREAAIAAPDAIVQEQWLGREYTVNVFFDRDKVLRCAVPHLRIETRGGEVAKGRTERVPALLEAAKLLAKALPDARGPLCFQAIVRDDGKYAVFEINARFGGGYPLAHEAGARFSRWLLEEVASLASTAGDDWAEGVTMLRYDAAVFRRE